MVQQRKRRETKKGEVSQPSLEASLIRRHVILLLSKECGGFERYEN